MLTIERRDRRAAAALREVEHGVEVRFARARLRGGAWRWGDREVIAAEWARVVKHVERVLNEEAGQ